jgi:hypothetical protein
MKMLVVVLFVVALAPAGVNAAPPGIAQQQQQGRLTPNPAPPTWNQWVTLFKDYMDLIGQFARVVEDPANAGVAAVIYTDDILRTRPPREAIDYYQKLLPEVRDPAVRRAIHLRLAEHYRLGNQPDEALAELRQLITAPPASQPAGGH